MKKSTLILSFCLANSFAFGQNFSKGLDFNDEAYAQVPVTATLTRGDFDHLPSSISLQKYAPTPGNQGQTGTCVAWSSAYHARTIAESIGLNRTDRTEIDQNTFSPSYIYNQIRLQPGCDNGTYIHQALELMQQKGVPKFSLLRFDCTREISAGDDQNATDYRIEGFKSLFNQDSNNKILPVKKSLSENKPVLIGMLCPESFFNAKDVWQPAQAEYGKNFGGHAMVTIGYDDNKAGGSFLVMNSWGTSWGNQGFIWISYSDYNHFVKYAFEMIDGRRAHTVALSGKLKFVKDDGSPMSASFDKATGIYKMDQAYNSGTKFRMLISNNEPAYVYAFGSDLSKKSFQIFPHNTKVSPYLGYKGNNVAIPDEKHYVRMDDNAGKDYFCVLYSKEALDMNTIMSKVANAPGNSFSERLHWVLKDKLVPTNEVNYSEFDIQFNAKTTSKTVVQITVEFEHE